MEVRIVEEAIQRPPRLVEGHLLVLVEVDLERGRNRDGFGVVALEGEGARLAVVEVNQYQSLREADVVSWRGTGGSLGFSSSEYAYRFMWLATLTRNTTVLPSGLMAGSSTLRPTGTNVSRSRMPSKAMTSGSDFFGLAGFSLSAVGGWGAFVSGSGGFSGAGGGGFPGFLRVSF